MKKKLFIILSFLLICFPLILSQEIEAASKYESNRAINCPVKVNGVKIVSRQYRSGSNYYCKIIMKKDGKNKVIADHTTAAFVTNGSTVFYVKQGSKISDYQYRTTIYQYNIKTEKAKMIISGTNLTVLNCVGNYLYYGTDNNAEGVDLYVLNLNTKKRKHMVNFVGNVYVSGKRIVTSTNTGSIGNYPIHSFKLNGSGKIKLADGDIISVKNGKVYYCVIDSLYSPLKGKVMSCNTDGSSKQLEEYWTNTMPYDRYR